MILGLALQHRWKTFRPIHAIGPSLPIGPSFRAWLTDCDQVTPNEGGFGQRGKQYRPHMWRHKLGSRSRSHRALTVRPESEEGERKTVKIAYPGKPELPVINAVYFGQYPDKQM